MTIQNIAQNQMSPAFMRVASGNRINSAADDAAGLAIAETMTAQIRGLDQGTRNSNDMQALIRTADGGLEGIGDNLQRIRELSIQAENGTLNQSQRSMIQEEIGQLTREIGAQVRGRVEFNGQSLLNNPSGNLHTASAADGSGMTVQINDMTSLAQAVADFNVAGTANLTTPDEGMSTLQRADMNFSTRDVDALLQEVNAQRANLGAMENRLDHTMQANMISSENLSDSRSRIRDADMALEMMTVNQERVINEMQVLLQAQVQNNMEEQGRRMISAVAGA